jgi:hypothetical protein
MGKGSPQAPCRKRGGGAELRGGQKKIRLRRSSKVEVTSGSGTNRVWEPASSWQAGEEKEIKGKGAKFLCLPSTREVSG